MQATWVFCVLLLIFGQGGAKPPQSDLPLSIASVKKLVTQMNVTIDTAKSNDHMLVTRIPNRAEGDVTIVLLLDPDKDRLGMFAYDFGNLAKAKDETIVLRRLLQANDSVALGSFFVDKDKDIGYKYTFGSTRSIDYNSFHNVYFSMVNIIKKYRGEIRDALEAMPADKPF